MAISKEDIKPLAWSADDEPTFLKDDEKKDGKNGNVAGSVDTVLRARRTFKKAIMESAEYTLGKGAG